LQTLISPAGPGARFKAAPSAAHHFLVFQLGGEQFAVDIAGVLECVHYRDLSAAMDGAGEVAWRGTILPWIDLRAGARDTTPATAPTDVIIFTLGKQAVAVAVDAALEVVVLADARITPLPPVGGLIGVGTHRQRSLYVFDLYELLSGAAAAAPLAAAESCSALTAASR